MNVKPGYAMRLDQREDPIIWRARSGLDPSPFAVAALRMVADHMGTGKSRRLMTWGRDPAAPDGPHWIGVRAGTTLHTDPRYPRYTHQVVLHNGGWCLSGIRRERIGEPFDVGAAFCCDTHSPHILLPDDAVAGDRSPYYLAASMDAREPIPLTVAIPELLRFIAKWAGEAAC